MAQVAAVSEMTGIVKDLIKDKTSQVTEGQVASTKAMEVVAEGAKAGIKIVQDANEYAARQREAADAERMKRESAAHAAQTPATPVAPPESPIRLAMELMQLMNQNRGSDEILSKFMEQSNKQMERMEKLFQDSLNRPQQQPTPIVDRIKDLKDLREISRDLFGDKEESGVAEGVADAAGDLAPKWLRPFIPLITPIAMGLAQGMMARGPVPGPGAMPPVQYPPTQALPYPPPPVQYPQYPGQPPAPAPIPTAPAPAPQPGSEAPAGMDQQVAYLLGVIRVPFLTQIQDPSLTGTDFAGWFVDGFGMPTHNQVIAFGPEALFQAVCAYPPIANDLAAMRMPEKRVRDFVAEFCDPKWDSEDGSGGGKEKDKDNPPASTPMPTPVA